MNPRRFYVTGSVLLVGVASLAVWVGHPARADQALAELRGPVAGLSETTVDVPWSPVIIEVQSALARLGFYKGSIDGKFSIATGYAVRVYRKTHNLEDGAADWAALLAHLESQSTEGAEVDARLERARRAQIKAARESLDQQVELQAVLRGGETESGPSAPQSYDCLVVPNADCLFRSAMQSAAEVAREEYRNWAFRDLIRAQALAGRYDDALASLKKLTDPRLIFVALREIAEAMARTGRFEKAIHTARLIPEPTHRARALANIAGRLAETRQYLQAREVGDEALQLMARERDVAERAITAAGFAEDLAAAGDGPYAARILRTAEADLGKTAEGPPRDAAWARLARARLALGDHAGATSALERVEDSRNRLGVIVSGAGETVRQGAPGRAMQLLSSIEDLRYRVLALCDVAYSHHRIGEAAKAMELVARAERMVESVDSPFAGSFARARIAETLLKLGRPGLAAKAAAGIGDDALRARMFWTVAEAHRAAGDIAAAERDERRAIEVAGSATSAFDRTAVLGDFAIGLARGGRVALARETYGNALQSAGRIKIDWWRARALAKVAGVLHELEARGVF